MTYFRFALACTAVSILTVSCSDNTNTAPALVLNQAPVISSAASVNVDENVSATVYNLTASDGDGDSLTLSAVNGGDAALFIFDAGTGNLSFQTPPDFEVPADANNDNVYEITLRAEDGRGGRADVNLSVTVQDVVQNFNIVRVGQNFQTPVYTQALPDGSGRMIVLEKGGRARLLNPDTGIIDPVDFIDVSADISTDGEGGLLGMVFSPDFETDGRVYFNVTNVAGDTEIRRYTAVAGRMDILDIRTGDVLLKVPQRANNHNAGWLGFGPDNLLYIPLGDGGGAVSLVAQDLTDLLGKVVRIDVRSDDFPTDPLRDYAIPPGNFDVSGTVGGRAEIFATGLRNPFRSSILAEENLLIIADVGEGAREEIDFLPLNDGTRNFGWPFVEGTQDLVGSAQPEYTVPITEYSHGAGEREGRSVTGGYVYRGPVEALQNEYVFADFGSGNIWSVPFNDFVDSQTLSSADFLVQTAAFQPDAGRIDFITSFGLDEAGNLFVVSLFGDVFRMEAAP